MSATPVLTTNGENRNDLDDTLIVNGNINIRKTHPNLYLMVMSLGIVCVALGINFFVFNPTFQVYHLPHPVWGMIWLTMGVTKLVFLNVYRSLTGVRMSMAFGVSFILFFAVGTCEPWLDGTGSLQLPIMYLGMAAIQIPMLLEPFINPWTALRE